MVIKGSVEELLKVGYSLERIRQLQSADVKECPYKDKSK
jgi:hypothetical protein